MMASGWLGLNQNAMQAEFPLVKQEATLPKYCIEKGLYLVIITMLFCERERINIRTPSGVNIFPKIVGGINTNIRTYPYIIQMYVNGNFHCGGSILTKQHILTAAHCVKDLLGRYIHPNKFLVRAGSTYLFKGGSLHKIAAYVIHPNYDKPVLHDNDIAVAVIDNPLVYSHDVQKASLPPQEYELSVNATVIAVGWGFTDIQKSQLSIVLNHVAVRHIDQSTCVHNFRLLEKVTSSPPSISRNMICAGENGIGGKDACQGDSGGPLVNDHVVVGLTSWGVGCGDPYFPGIYSRVSSYTDWINNVIDTDDPEHSHMIKDQSSQVSSAVAPGTITTVLTLSHMLIYCTMFC